MNLYLIILHHTQMAAIHSHDRRSATFTSCISIRSASYCKSPYYPVQLLYFSATNINPPVPPDLFIHKYRFIPKLASRAALFAARMRNDVLLSFLQFDVTTHSHLERNGLNMIIHSLSVLKRLLGSDDHVIKLI